MAGHGRPQWPALAVALLTLFFSILLAGHGSAGPPAADHLDPMLQDAELTDVMFIDGLRGWAVGDRGLILATINGGKHWQRQPSGASCRLECVHFIDADNGWAAGGISHPYTHASRGVLLRTRNGGRTWAQDQALLVSGLKRVKFFNEAQGWAFGESSALFPSGVFTTEDGGRSWSSVGGLPTPGWLAGDFVDPLTGAVAGRSGTVATVRRRSLEQSLTPGFGLRGLHRMTLSGPATGWLVGDGGLVLTTVDLGATWQTPAGDPDDVVGRHFDWRAVDVHGPRCWVGGSPGSRILHSPDSGQTWEAFATGQNLPILGLSFVDDQRGWAVGALGTVLATSDGGRTWQRQRSGGTRAALLALFSEPDAVPLEVIAGLCGNEGYLGAVCLLSRRDQEPGSSAAATLADRARAALLGVGASAVETAWAFPLRQPGLAVSAEQLVDAWNRANDGQGLARLEEQLVRSIRTWRPDVVLTHAASSAGDEPLGHLVNQVALRAVEQAADATRYPDQLSEAGLEAWQVKKVCGRLPPGQPGDMNVTTSQVAPRLGGSLADCAVGPRGMIFKHYAPAPVTWGFNIYVDRLPQGVGKRDFFSGILLHPGGEARRVLSEPPAQGIDTMRRIAQKHRNVQAILARNDQAGGDPTMLLAQLGDLTGGLDASAAGDVLYQLGAHYHASGRWEMAADVFDLLASRYPEHALTEAALVWLVQYWSSSEAAWRTQRSQRVSAGRTVTDRPASPFAPPDREGQTNSAAIHLRARGTSALAIEVAGDGERASRAIASGKRLEQANPVFYSEPTVRFPLAVAYRSQGLGRQAERFYLDVARTRPRDAWWSCAAGEGWLDEPKGLAPKSLAHAATGSRPRLDGVLDDEVWRRGKPLELTSALGDDALWPAVALVAYDHEFLYLAVNCRLAPGLAYEPQGAPRPRDSDLSAQDRVDFYLDLDRDWATYYRLTIDHRGWTGEACWHDVTWNPTWFVAARTEANSWTAEAAVPLEELTGQYPQSRHVWALGVQRTVPGAGFQSWTTPAATTAVPEGFGYLIFD